MRTSPVWTATYAAEYSHSGNPLCYSVTWGQEGGQPIPLNVAKELAEGLLKEHTTPTNEMPRLVCIRHLYPYQHNKLGYAYINGETDYHKRDK